MSVERNRRTDIPHRRWSHYEIERGIGTSIATSIATSRVTTLNTKFNLYHACNLSERLTGCTEQKGSQRFCLRCLRPILGLTITNSAFCSGRIHASASLPVYPVQNKTSAPGERKTRARGHHVCRPQTTDGPGVYKREQKLTIGFDNCEKRPLCFDRCSRGSRKSVIIS